MSVQSPNLVKQFTSHPRVQELNDFLHSEKKQCYLKGMIGSSTAMVAASVFESTGKQQHIMVMPDKEQAAYFYNDLENLFEEKYPTMDVKVTRLGHIQRDCPTHGAPVGVRERRGVVGQ